MLTALRRNVANPILLVPIVMIIVVFIFTFGSWGGSDVSGTMPTAAIVNGRVIPQAQFDVMYSREFQDMQRRKPGYNTDAAKAEEGGGLKAVVVDRLIDLELLAQEAEDKGLVVTDEQLRVFIQGAFFRDEPFDAEQYERIVSANYQTTMPRFEEQIRREILAQRMASLVTESIKVSSAEVRETFNSRADRADLQLIRVDPLFFKKSVAPLSGDDLSAWLTTNDAKVKAYYDEFINRYREEAQVEARHILIKTPPNATDAQKEQARKKTQDIKTRIDAGEDFATVATELSEDKGSARMGGSLGKFAKAKMVPPFAKAAFALDEGKVSDLVETNFGFHIIKVEKKFPAKVRELKDVREEIAQKLSEESLLQAKAKAVAEDALTQLKAGTDVEKVTIKGLLTTEDLLKEETPDPFAPRVESTGMFSKNARYVPRVGTAAEIVEAAFKLTKEAPVGGKVYEVKTGVSTKYFVIKLKEREVPDESKFAEEKALIEMQLRRSREGGVLKSYTEKLRKGAKLERNEKVLKYGS